MLRFGRPPGRPPGSWFQRANPVCHPTGTAFAIQPLSVASVAHRWWPAGGRLPYSSTSTLSSPLSRTIPITTATSMMPTTSTSPSSRSFGTPPAMCIPTSSSPTISATSTSTNTLEQRVVALEKHLLQAVGCLDILLARVSEMSEVVTSTLCSSSTPSAHILNPLAPEFISPSTRLTPQSTSSTLPPISEEHDNEYEIEDKELEMQCAIAASLGANNATFSSSSSSSCGLPCSSPPALPVHDPLAGVNAIAECYRRAVADATVPVDDFDDVSNCSDIDFTDYEAEGVDDDDISECSFDSVKYERVMSEMHKQNIFNDERCGNDDDDGEDEWVSEQFDRIWKELKGKDIKDKKDKC